MDNKVEIHQNRGHLYYIVKDENGKTVFLVYMHDNGELHIEAGDEVYDGPAQLLLKM